MSDHYTPAQRAAYNREYRKGKPKDVPWSQWSRVRRERKK